MHAVDPRAQEVYTYSQDLKTWHLDRDAASDFYFPELDEVGVAFTEVSHAEVYSLLPKSPKMDRRDDAMRRESNRERAQIRRSGQVLTSAEVGLLTKPLKQRPATMPMLKELLETRSQHKRWTALYLYEEDGAARRKSISTLRSNGRINVSSRGALLNAQYRTRRFEIDGEVKKYVAVEAKYGRPAEQEISEGRGSDD
ncbi:hypothetical protein ACT3TB_19290 [Micrococcaceae sp. AOP34-BR2-30]